MDIPEQLLKKYGPVFHFGLFAPTTADVKAEIAGFPAFHSSAGVYVTGCESMDMVVPD
jgi:hypothetical protein